MILSGKEVKDSLTEKLSVCVGTLETFPELVIIQVGDKAESTVYIEQKKKYGASLDIPVHHITCDEHVSEKELLDIIHLYNRAETIKGIIVQLPLPGHLNKRIILDAIAKEKDVDGLGKEQMELLYSGDDDALLPATVRGIFSLCDYYNIEFSGKHIVMVGRSDLVGKPMAIAALGRNATVTVCHSHTVNLSSITQTADILVVACGVPRLIGKEYITAGQYVIDVGMHRTETGLCGDVDFEAIQDVVSGVSPVPGGVGPLTVVSLFENLCDAQTKSHVLQ